MKMPIISTQKQIKMLGILLLVKIWTGNCENAVGFISLRPEPDAFYHLKAAISKTNYQEFQDAFLNNGTLSLTLKYDYQDNDQIATINNIDKQTNNIDPEIVSILFRCYVVQSSMSIQCNKTVLCSNSGENVCAGGFGISWLKEDEYLTLDNYQNVTHNCGSFEATCYILKDIATSTIIVNSPFTTSYQGVNTDASTTITYSTESTAHVTSTPKYTNASTKTTYPSTVYEPTKVSSVVTLIIDNGTIMVDRTITGNGTTAEFFSESMNEYISTPGNTLNNVTSTINSIDLSIKDISSASTAIIAGVTISVLLVIITFVFIVFFIMRKRKARKMSSKNKEMRNSDLEVRNSANSDSIYSKHLVNFNEYNSKPTSSNVTNNDQITLIYNTNTNNYIDSPSKSKKCVSIFHPKPDLDYAGVEEHDSATQPDRLLSSETDKNCYYSTLNSNIGSLVPRSSNENNGGVDGNSSSVNKVHPVSPKDEYSIVNKNCGYKNIKEIEQNESYADQHEYNNVQNNTAAVINESTKNVYSKLRENIRHFEHPYGDEEVSKQTEEDNSTVGLDIIYFILEKEEI